MAQILKDYLYNICVGDFYQFRIYRVTDAAQQIYYIGEPVDRGGTKIDDTIEGLKAKLEAQVYLLNKHSGLQR